jgi:hypothetical protein
MLNCLRHTDLWHIAGLLSPARIVVAGECPSTFDWAEAVHARLGGPHGFRRVRSLTEWTDGSVP